MSTETRREAYSQIGGHRALDLVNTVEWRLNPGRLVDDLHDYDDVLRWAAQSGLLPEEQVSRIRSRASGPAAAAEFERVRDLREAVYTTVFEGGDPALLAGEYAEAVDAGALARAEDGWRWSLPVDLALPRHSMALDAFDLLTRTDLSDLAQCQDADCGWVFLDSSPRRNRRWCVAEDCGNRNRAREFYRRSREVTAG